MVSRKVVVLAFRVDTAVKGSGENTDEMEYRRIGAMHAHNGHLGADIEQDLMDQESQTLVLV